MQPCIDLLVQLCNVFVGHHYQSVCYLLVGAAQWGWQLRERQWLSCRHHVYTFWDSK